MVFDDVTKLYKGRSSTSQVAVDHLRLSIAEGNVFGFLGPNGAGKSTAIKILLNLIFPTSGQALLLGKPAADTAVRSRVGYLPESPNFYDHLTPEELLWFGGKTSGLRSNQIKERTDSLLDLVDLARVRRQRLRTFSKGMIQRAGVALALVNDPDVVVLDEPMSGLDPLGRKLMADIIRRLKHEGKTVFFSSHILHDVEDLCDQVGIIVNARLRRVAGLADVLSVPATGWSLTVKATPDTVRSHLTGVTATHTARGGLTEIRTSEMDLGKLLDRLGALKEGLVSATPLRPTLEDILLQEIEHADGESR
ncbi:MAG: ABC transporter ATP-binding protein [Nitrospirae bacterium]|nr:ABC transporter ATP-binding protein [Nitrospirota bacterium]